MRFESRLHDARSHKRKTLSTKIKYRTQIRKDIVNRYLFDASEGECLPTRTIGRCLEAIDTHRGIHASSQDTTSRKIIDRACQAALLMRPYVDQPISFKSKHDISIFLSRVVAGEFYVGNLKGCGFFGSGAIDIVGLNSDQVHDIKRLFIDEGELRISSHDTASLDLTNELVREQQKQRGSRCSPLLDMQRRYNSGFYPVAQTTKNAGTILAFNIPPSIVNPENGDSFGHIMLFNIFKPDSKGLYTVRLKPEDYGWKVRGTTTKAKIHHGTGFIKTKLTNKNQPNYYSEKNSNPNGAYIVDTFHMNVNNYVKD